MDADAFFVERDPDHADRTIWTRREHMEITAAHAVLQHLFVPAKPWQLSDLGHFPFANW